MTKTLKCILIAFLIGGILSGCGASLTNEEAENIIKKWYPQKTEAYAVIFSIGVNKIESDNVLLDQLEELKKKGLIDYQYTGTQQSDPNFKEVSIQVNEKGKPYLEDTGTTDGTKMFLVVLENFDGIENISSQGNYVKVDYTCMYEPAEPFSEEEINRLYPDCLDEKVFHSVHFIHKNNKWIQAPEL